MIKFILKRFIDLIPTLLIVITIVFVITRIIPGDPAIVLLGPQASVEDVNEMNQKLGLNEPIYKQYFHYIANLLQGDLGDSIAYNNQSVAGLILERFPNTLILGISAILIALVVGVTAGVVAAVKQNTVIDYSVIVMSLVGVSMPVFWLGLMLVLLFSVNLGWLPSIGIGNLEDGFWNFIKYLILPSIALATIPMAEFARITRSSMLEVVNHDYIKTARSKGLSELRVICKHAFKNSLTPLLTVSGMQISMMLGGAILTETIFSWPGVGRLIIDAIDKRDFMVVQGTVLFIAIVFVLVNLVVDILYKVVNPRVNYSSGKGGGK
ncbi:ABC transporter permease [Alteribacter populi]|uniref:ABC transporter permease n=1 Tax=Alteribacter populi TaxID=2011011 RepID=UPI000BBAD53B|nr:ABC transporter permease [Alteribacter populi]